MDDLKPKRKKILVLLLGVCITAIVMPGLPRLAVTLVTADSGMPVSLLLFLAVNPLYAALVGLVSAADPKVLWLLPFAVAETFILGAMLAFECADPSFYLYAGIYLLLGIGFMLLRVIWKKERKQTAAREIRFKRTCSSHGCS